MQNRALKLVRQFHKLSLTETANRLGISKSYLSLIENGHKKPTLDLVEAYAKTFNMPVSQLMLFAEGIGDPRPGERVRRAIAGKAVRMLQWLE
ncbi:MAG: helix-turn-helix domain-containing protein, partial [Steroidobacteraceae bacterium]